MRSLPPYAARAGLFVGLAALALCALLWTIFLRPPPAPPGPMDEWRLYKSRFVAPEGRSVDPLQGGRTTSEGQGYAMLLAVAYDDRPTFDALWRWTLANLSIEGETMFRWRWNPGAQEQERAHATDGDILIAWALLRASRKWNVKRYSDAAIEKLKILQDPKLLVDVDGRRYFLPGRFGFRKDDGSAVVNPSYYVFPAFQEFSEVNFHGAWGAQLDVGLRLIERSWFGEFGLPADWVRVSKDGSVAASNADGAPDGARIGYEGIRVPLHLLWANFADPKLLKPFRMAWTAERIDPQIPIEIGLPSGQVYTRSMGTGFRAIERAVNCAITTEPLPATFKIEPWDDYYSASLYLLTKLALRERFPHCLPLQSATAASN